MITGPSDTATLPPAPPEVSSNGFLAGAAITAAIAGATVAASLPALCPFRICTGHACPGCGLSRSVVSLFKGDVAMSWRYHPLLIPFIVQIAVVSLMRRAGASMVWYNTLLIVNLVVILGVWAVRWRLGQLDLVVGR